ncbi:unnamed protein product [Moneuplotes crassus]|uniref:Cytochrome b5 heme-binding domain-containing protein n=1 Tax=Euplotes crassus TaxID=5936 RepID=A0AAD1Y273_EUPCR|nr:unnamed protein product [Moneuplotes crassus]
MSDDILEWFYFSLPLAVFVVFWFVFGDKILGRGEPQRMPRDMPPEEVDEKDYIYLTKEQLKEFDGVKREDKKIYIGVKNEIFDLTKNAEMYGPEGAYGCFSGKEVSIAMAKNSTEEDVINTPYESFKLNVSYQDSLDSWYWFFRGKYPMIGKVVPDKKND